MGRVTIQDYPVLNKYYYVVDFRNLYKVRLMPAYYLSITAAERAIRLNYPKKRRKLIEVMKGDKVKNFFMVYDMKPGKGKFTKYEYGDKQGIQERKTFRTVMRRRLRRMGLLTLVKPKKSIKKAPDYIKPIKNKQKVAINKNSAAKVIQLERKPSYYYYLIISKKLAKKRGRLWRIKCNRFNNKTGEFKKVILYTMRTDILIPHLITDLENLVYEKIQEKNQQPDVLVYYQEWGFRMAGR